MDKRTRVILTVVIVLLGLGVGLYWYQTRAVRNCRDFAENTLSNPTIKGEELSRAHRYFFEHCLFDSQ